MSEQLSMPGLVGLVGKHAIIEHHGRDLRCHEQSRAGDKTVYQYRHALRRRTEKCACHHRDFEAAERSQHLDGVNTRRMTRECAGEHRAFACETSVVQTGAAPEHALRDWLEGALGGAGKTS